MAYWLLNFMCAHQPNRTVKLIDASQIYLTFYQELGIFKILQGYRLKTVSLSNQLSILF